MPLISGPVLNLFFINLLFEGGHAIASKFSLHRSLFRPLSIMIVMMNKFTCKNEIEPTQFSVSGPAIWPLFLADMKGRV
jgi:hypothetical protein